MRRLLPIHGPFLLLLTLAVLFGSAGVTWYKNTLTDRKMLTVLLGNAGVSWSADYQKGLDAAKSVDFATALREWRPLAQQGNAKARYNLGIISAHLASFSFKPHQ